VAWTIAENGTTSRRAGRSRTDSPGASSAACEANALTSISSDASRRRATSWRRIDYNTDRPHTSPSSITPTEFANRSRMDQNLNRLSL
jgi:hypothetical protein